MAGKKIITISIPCYNEEENVELLAKAIMIQFEKHLPNYDYYIQFIDNCSIDGTRGKIEEICKKDTRVRAIFNARNFGPISSYYGIMQAEGDGVIVIPADFQVPVELIPLFVSEWEQGGKVVCAIKTSSKENKGMWMLRSLYYALLQRFSDTVVLKHFNGAGLYDRSFIDICKKIDDPMPSIAQMVSTLGYNIRMVEFVQPVREAGKTSNNFFRLFDQAIFRFINYSKVGPRIATLLGMSAALISLLIALVYLVLKLMFWDTFIAGMAPLVIGIFFFFSVQLFFTGLIGEYVIAANSRLMKRPLVIEEKRINF